MTTLREAVERAARVLGMWLGDGEVELPAAFEAIKSSVSIGRRVDGAYSITHGREVWKDHGDGVRSTTGKPRTRVDDLTAALVLLCHALPETRERCPDCEGKGVEHVAGETPPPGYRCPNGWAWNVVQGRWERPCACCSATGWVPRSWGAVLLGAMPQQDESVGRIYEQAREQGVDAVALRDAAGAKSVMSRVRCSLNDREALAVLADDRMRQGDPLGEWLALWLDAVPCSAVCDHGWRPHPTKMGRVAHEHCRGSGLELGAHEQVIVSALNNLCANLQKAPT